MLGQIHRSEGPFRRFTVPFADGVCVPFLRSSQNQDGGWGYTPGSPSCVEPTCWALLALTHLDGRAPRMLLRGITWLQRAQLPDGSWPSHPGLRHGCWLTSLASLVLQIHGIVPEAVESAARWLCSAWPAEGGYWWRLKFRLFAKRGVVRQNFALRGWSWTPGTSSWVEPTACALVFLRNLPEKARPRQAAARIRLAESMLYDRMISSGGWNCGNTSVYNITAEPSVWTTAWALLALRHNATRTENQTSLRWLERSVGTSEGPASIALAQLCLRAHGIENDFAEARLEQLYSTNQFLELIPVIAVASLALRESPRWLREPAPICEQPLQRAV